MKKGTGEGAQAYGVGAGYTAEARKVAEEYAKSNAGRAAALSGEIDKLPKPVQMEVYKAMQMKDGFIKESQIQDIVSRYPETKSVIGKSETYLYKGDIPDEILPKFLDWDQPISNQKEVRQILESENLQDLLTRNEPRKVGRFTQVRIGGEPSGAEITGADLYRNLTEKLGSEKSASDYLESIGIRGIRYLDQGSRGSGEGTSNFIPFSPEDFRIQEINDRPIEEYISQGLL
jgi:hypothetical protein